MFFREIVDIPSPAEALGDGKLIEEMREGLHQGVIYVARNVFPRDDLLRIREYLARIGQSSLPNYEPLTEGAPNFHRVYGDSRSYVRGRFHQWSFFPWNMDVFDLFELVRPAYRLNNRVNGWPEDKYLGQEPQEGCVARLTFQAYPQGAGYIARHQDVAGPHKFTTVLLTLSDKGTDYRQGGAYFARSEDENEDFDADDVLRIGDLIYTHSEVVHGVAPIDPDARPNWLDFQGKWTLVLAVNKLAGASHIADSKDLGKS